MQVNKKIAATATGVGSALVAGASFAQGTSGVDVSAVTAALTAAGVAAGTIGLAWLAMLAGIKLYKWVRAAM